ncbi:MAG: thymidylate synthase [Nanoarchaeota archaeon]|nr:thymidylate synthase [Nanoarchaeota archaeon]
MVEQYLEHCRRILTNPASGYKPGSKGAGLISLFGHQNEYDLKKGFPLLTTKKMFTRGVIEELLWFFRGDTNIRYLEERGVTIWRPNTFQYHLPAMIKEGIFPKFVGMDEAKYSAEWEQAMEDFGQMIKESEDFAARWGDAGPIYGKQWRGWEHYNKKTGRIDLIDQLGNAIEGMKKKPFGKKYMLTAWNPGQTDEMSQPSCHVLSHLDVNEDEDTGKLRLDLGMYQRSSDMFLGVPFNIASYSILTHIIANQLGLEPGRFVHSFGDAHFYTGLQERSEWYSRTWKELKQKARVVSSNEEFLNILNWINQNAPSGNEERYDHVTAILEQLTREPKPLPRLSITPGKSIDDLTIDDFKIEGYKSYPLIKREMHV